MLILQYIYVYSCLAGMLGLGTLGIADSPVRGLTIYAGTLGFLLILKRNRWRLEKPVLDGTTRRDLPVWAVFGLNLPIPDQISFLHVTEENPVVAIPKKRGRPRTRTKETAPHESINTPRATYYGATLASISFPPSPQKKRIWQRTNGNVTLFIEAGKRIRWRGGKPLRNAQGEYQFEEIGLPYGIVPRWTMLHLSNEYKTNTFVQKTNQIKLGNSLNYFVENELGMGHGGKQWGDVRDHIDRLFSAKIGYAKQNNDNKIEFTPMMPIVKNLKIWWHSHPEQESFLESSVTITDEFAEILKNSLPLRTETIQRIGKSVLGFDIYTWLNWRHYELSKTITSSFVPLNFLYQQFGAGYSRPRDFKRKFETEFARIKQIYPHNSHFVDSKTRVGVMLAPSDPDVKQLK